MKKNIVYIVGHKNPDIDSVSSAICYAFFKNTVNLSKQYIPISCGEINNKIKNLLNFLNVDIPIFKNDLYPRLNDIIYKNKLELNLKENTICSNILNKNIDINYLPVINNENEIKGYIDINKIKKYFFDLINKIFLYPSVKLDNNFNLKLNINELKNNLKSHFIKNNNLENIEDFEIILSLQNIKNKNIILILDKKNYFLQKNFINEKVKLIIIKDSDFKDKNLFKNNNINFLLTNSDEIKIILSLLKSCQINSFIEKNNLNNFCFYNQEKIIDIKQKLKKDNNLKKEILFSIINNNNKVLGYFNSENLNENFSNQIILVDHNEKSQSIDGVEPSNIIEIIDHHRLSNEPTINPIKFINEPLGSTCTIITEMFYHNRINFNKKIAGLLISGIISDTINLKSPTTTEKDKEMLKWLQNIYNFDLDEIFKKIFYSYSVLDNESIDSIVKYDCKIYKELNISFSISQIEEVSFINFYKKYKDILQYMKIFMKENNLDFSLFCITNIKDSSSLLLISENKKYNIIKHINYPSINNEKIIFELKDIVSRKKQLTPYIINIIKNLKF